MAWTEPIYNRTSGTARMTYVDMNRITGNLVFLYDFLTEKGIPVYGSKYRGKTEWSQNDILVRYSSTLGITVGWASMLVYLRYLYDAVGYTPVTSPNNNMTYQNINTIEYIEFVIYETAKSYGDMYRINHYIGDTLYAGDAVNAGGQYG